MKKPLAIPLAGATEAAAGCSLDSELKADGQVDVVVGYQSKTINTVTARNTAARQGFLENRLADITKRTNTAGTTSPGRITTPVHRSPRRWSPRRSTSARWVTTCC